MDGPASDVAASLEDLARQLRSGMHSSDAASALEHYTILAMAGGIRFDLARRLWAVHREIRRRGGLPSHAAEIAAVATSMRSGDTRTTS